jgi:CRP/FNR family transcriptional activator FtrB
MVINAQDRTDVIVTPFFSRLSPDGRERLLSVSYVQPFAPGRILCRANDPCSFAYVSLDDAIGWVATQEGGKEWVLDFVPPGEVMGLLAVRSNQPRAATGRVIDSSRVLLIPAAALRAGLETDPRSALAALDMLAVRVPRLIRQIGELKSRSASQRLAGFILELLDAGGHAHKAGEAMVTLPWSRSLIATRLGIVPESMSRVFAELKAYGVEGRGAQLSIRSVRRLRELAQESALRGKLRSG